jgi:hypothetical protein
VRVVEFGFAKMSNGRPANEDDSNRRVVAPGENPAKKRGIYLLPATRLASPTDSLRVAQSKDRNMLQAMAAATDKAHRQHFGAAPVQPARARRPELEPSTQGSL